MHRILQVGLVPKDNLEQWLKQEEIQHITVLEPHPQLVQQLQQQYSGQTKLQVVAAALSPNPGLQTLIDYSLPGFSSLSPATGLKRLFPGLQDTQHLEVNALSPTHFLEQYGPESGQTATLVIHAKGYEAELIQELIRSPALLRFTDVLLYSAADSLYEHSADTAILQKQLIEAGYELLQEQVVSPEWTESYFKRNAVQDEIVLLRQQLKNKEQLEVALAQSQSEIQALQQAVVAEKSVANQHAQQAQKLQAVLENVKKEFNVFQAQWTTKENDQQKQRQQFEAALAAIEAERQKAVALSEQLAADLQQTKQANQAAEIAREQLQSELQALQKAVTTEKALADKQAQQTQKTQASLDEAKKELIALQAQLTTKENDQQKQRQQFEAALAAIEAERQKAVALADQQTQQLKTLQAELEQAKQEIALTLENSKKELIAKDKSLVAQQQELISAKKNQQLITEQLQTTEAKLKEHEQWLRNRKKQVEELEQALQQEQQKAQQLQTEKGALAQLESRMEQLFNQQATQIQQATNALGKHVTKSFVDQRQHDQALMGLHQYLEKGEQPLNFDAWSMGVDTLTYLVRQIEQNNYDVIIEFGSGTSTVVMAKAVAQRLTSQRYSQITKNDNSNHLPYEDIESHAVSSVSGSQAAALLDKAEYDLPRQILSFEQDRNYLNQTKQALASHGVSQVVELVLAPLVPSRYSALPSEQKPLFYDCEKQLERLARLFEQRNARILVVVDGPFSPKNNPLIREPALGTVLQYLSAQHLDILLDDSHRSGEQQVLEHWQELCEERGLTYKVQALDVVKGATWVTVRPE